MDGWYVCPLNAHAWNVFLQKHGFLGLTPVYSKTTALSKPYFILKLQSVRKFLRKCLLFKKQKVDSTESDWLKFGTTIVTTAQENEVRK